MKQEKNINSKRVARGLFSFYIAILNSMLCTVLFTFIYAIINYPPKVPQEELDRFKENKIRFNSILSQRPQQHSTPQEAMESSSVYYGFIGHSKYDSEISERNVEVVNEIRTNNFYKDLVSKLKISFLVYVFLFVLSHYFFRLRDWVLKNKV